MYIFTQSESQLAYKHRKELWCAVVITSRAVLRFETYIATCMDMVWGPHARYSVRFKNNTQNK